MSLPGGNTGLRLPAPGRGCAHVVLQCRCAEVFSFTQGGRSPWPA